MGESEWAAGPPTFFGFAELGGFCPIEEEARQETGIVCRIQKRLTRNVSVFDWHNEKGGRLFMRIGVMTGGGDSSGINAVIRTIVTQARRGGDEVWGIQRGWEGLLRGNIKPLTIENTAHITYTGGTAIGSSRTNLFKIERGFETAIDTIDRFKLDAIIAMGGDDTLGVAHHLSKLGVNTVGLPQTIDNDVGGTEYCIGFDTAVTRIVETVNNMRTSCQSHGQDVVVEAMGRESGWLAAISGLITESDAVIIPELPVTFDEVVRKVRSEHQKGNDACVIMVAEGCELEGCSRIEKKADEFGHIKLAGIGYGLREHLQREAGSTIRCHILGYCQRGGDPTTYEVMRSFDFGRVAYQTVKQGGRGQLIAVQGGHTVPVTIDAVKQKRFVTPDVIEQIKELYA